MSQSSSYTTKDINEVQNHLNYLENELVNFDSKEDETKKDLFSRIIHDVDILVSSGNIEIKKADISSYIYSKYIIEKNISYHRSKLAALCNEDQKRNYSIDPVGSIHKHEFEIKSKTDNGVWEQCWCSVNRINGIIQIEDKAQLEKEHDKFSSKTVKNIIEPNGIEFEWIQLKKEEYSHLITAIDLCIKKCTIDKTAIKNQTILKLSRRSSTDDDYTKLLQSTTTLTQKRISIIQKELSSITPNDTKQIKKTIAQLIYTKSKLNDKTKITLYEKSLAKILIERFAYDKSDIARILNINTKHVKNNILQENKSIFHRIESMKALQFLKRCTNCGVNQADHIEEKIQQFKEGKPITEDFDLENFALPTYAKQCDELLEKNRILKVKIRELKVK